MPLSEREDAVASGSSRFTANGGPLLGTRLKVPESTVLTEFSDYQFAIFNPLEERIVVASGTRFVGCDLAHEKFLQFVDRAPLPPSNGEHPHPNYRAGAGFIQLDASTSTASIASTSDPATAVWSVSTAVPGGGVVALASNNAQIVAFTNVGGTIRISTDNGVTWSAAVALGATQGDTRTSYDGSVTIWGTEEAASARVVYFFNDFSSGKAGAIGSATFPQTTFQALEAFDLNTDGSIAVFSGSNYNGNVVVVTDFGTVTTIAAENNPFIFDTSLITGFDIESVCYSPFDRGFYLIANAVADPIVGFISEDDPFVIQQGFWNNPDDFTVPGPSINSCVDRLGNFLMVGGDLSTVGSF